MEIAPGLISLLIIFVCVCGGQEQWMMALAGGLTVACETFGQHSTSLGFIAFRMN